MLIAFLAHLSRRLIGELILKYTHAPGSVGINNFKHLFQNRFPDQSQILCGASLGRGGGSLFAAFGSHGQDGGHAKPIHGKNP